MSKARAAVLLGGLTMVGMLVFSSLVGADNEHSYFHSMKGAIGRGCLQYATLAVGDDHLPWSEERQEMFLGACAFITSTLRELSPGLELPPGDREPELREALLDAFGAETPGLSTRSSCDECLDRIQDLETYLATNHTAADLWDAVALGCRKKFANKPVELDECLQNVAAAEVPSLIDYTLSNYSAATACTALLFCPQ